jgi:uncharacterized protein
MDLHRYFGIAQDVFAVALVAVFPLIDLPALQRLKRFSSGPARLALYRRGVFSTWAFMLAALALTSLGTLLVVPRRPGDLPWLDGYPAIHAIIAICLGALFVWILWPSVQCALSRGIRQKYFQAYRSSFIRFLLPVSRQERIWWVLLSVTAGVCEELLYRGYMLQYLRGHLAGGPALGLTLAWLLSSLAFGAGHVYQGKRGVAETTIAGLVFGLLAIITGNLVLPIVLHSLVDLRILLTYHPTQDAPEEAAVLISGFHLQNH